MIIRTSIAVLMFCEAFMLGMLAENYVFPMLIMLATLALYFKPLELDVSLGVKILVPTVLVGYFFFRYVAVPEAQSRTEWVFPSNITVSLSECFLIGQLFELIKRRDQDDGLLNFCLLAMAVVVCCCCRYASGSERSLLFVGSVISITLICTIFQYSTRTFMSADQAQKPNLFNRGMLISFTMGMIGVSSWYLSGSLQANIEDFQSWWMRSFQVSGLNVSESSIGYTDEATLKNITALKKSDPLKPTLHIYSDSPPGYMRGRAYDTFNGRNWLRRIYPREVIGRETPPESIESLDRHFFRIADSPFQRFKQIRVENQVGMPIFFLPLNATYVSGKSVSQTSIVVDVESVLEKGIRNNEQYSAYVDQNSPVIELSEFDWERLTTLPEKLEPQALTVAREVAPSANTDAQRIEAIEEYFNNNYTYTLNQKEFPRTRDQLSYFITEKPAAHCEFFASAAVVFLRANGIPARYVTGFATDELSTEEDYYLARNQDAHAWAEAYDREKKQWVIVEATPGTVLPKSVWDEDFIDNSTAQGNGGGADSGESRTGLSGFLLNIWIQIRVFFEEIGRQLRGPINIAIFSLIVFSLFYQFWWKPRRNSHLGTRLGMLERERLKVEKLLSRLKFKRQENETMFQFEQRLRHECEPKLLDKIGQIFDWFREYERSRFSKESSVESIPIAPAIKL